jgi:hypothetical protein
MSQVQLCNDERFVNERMLADMEKEVRVLFDQLCVLEGGLAVLRLFNDYADTIRTLDDIAHYLPYPNQTVGGVLQALGKLDLVCRKNILGFSFYRFTTDSEKRRLVRDLCQWQDRWYARSALIENVLDGKAVHLFASGTDVPNNA